MKKIEEMDWDDLHPYLGRGNPRYDEAWDRALVLQIGLLEAIHEQSDPGSLIKATAANAVDAMCVKLRRYRSKIERRRVRAEIRRMGASDGRA